MHASSRLYIKMNCILINTSSTHFLLVILIFSLKSEEANSTRKFQASTDFLSDYYEESFDFGREVNIEEILHEIEAMGMHSKLKQSAASTRRPCLNQNRSNCRNNLEALLPTSSQQVENDSHFQADDRVVASDASTQTPNNNDSYDQTMGNNLDYSLDAETSNSVYNSYWDSSELFLHLNSSNERQNWSMDDSVSDILDDGNGRREARGLIHYDRGYAFNTSVAFTVPFFQFYLPGGGEGPEGGIDSNVLASLAFVTFFLLGWLWAAIYTTTQGSVGHEDSARHLIQPLFPGAKFLRDSSALPAAVHGALEELADALEVKSCTHLATCEAYTDLHANSLLSLPFRAYTPLRDDVTDESVLTSLEVAARRSSGSGSCRREYPCIVDPFELMNLVIDWVTEKISL
ncbi:uncharacterized protein LOC108667439 [Hyalella azteca]|uniref:Uncharacterized protein LOC108667439 n=1 Tax=Hyalella azteca TaxID=294128 RepID=A0A8B7N7S4_HYAAZ|nr:uncharacterized protein LOC108667439 [Hyalella azteca]